MPNGVDSAFALLAIPDSQSSQFRMSKLFQTGLDEDVDFVWFHFFLHSFSFQGIILKTIESWVAGRSPTPIRVVGENDLQS
jgi:hypothetical protein